MEIKMRNLHYVFLCALFFLISILFLPAQTTRYFLNMDSAEPRFIQPPLSWNDDEKTLRYDVIIEKKTNEEYRQVLRKFTDVSFIEVFLEPGRYRYRVIPYNYLNRVNEGLGSNWKDFDVIATFKPELHNFSPSVFYVDKDAVHELTISAKNLTPSAKIYLRHTGDTRIDPKEQYIDENGSHARLLFNNDQLIPGEYEIVAINPGRMETSKEGFTIAVPKELLTFRMSAGMYWPNMSTYWKQFSDQSSFPGYMLFASATSNKWKKNFDYTLKLRYAFKADTDDYYLMCDIITFLIRMWLPNQSIAFCIRPGFGFLFPLNGQEVDYHFSLDVSVWSALGKHLFLEVGVVGVDFLLNDSLFNDFNPYFYPPFFMLGYQF